MLRYKKWFRALMIYSLLFLFAIICFNYLVNPYNIFKVAKIQNFNEKKIETKEYLKKARDLVEQKPDVILLGTSRTRVGLDPDYYYRKTGEAAYNLGLSGANMYEQRRYFEYSLLVNPNLKKVIMGLDFEAFNEYRPNTINFSDERLNTKYYTKTDLLVNLLSYLVTKDSIRVILDNIKREDNYTSNRMLNNGSHNEDIILSTHKSLLDSGRNRFYEHLHEQLQDETVLQNYRLSKNRLNDLEYIINSCLTNNIELIIFIHPVHAIQLEGIKKAGLWNDYEQWKKEIVNLSSVWDFTGYNEITTSSPTNFNTYLDQSHYRKKVGNLIFDRLSSPLDNSPFEFGLYINNENINDILLETKLERIDWKEENPNILKIISEL
jgi:hypothetical protein